MTLRTTSSLVFLVVALLVLAGPVFAQTQLPEMELRVTDVEDTPEINPDTAGEWSPLHSGRRLRPGDRVRTGKDASVELEVPGVSYFRVTESSLIEVQELDRTEEERGLVVTETVVVNDIKLRELRGTVQSSLRTREGVANDYELETPNAVAGIRGTDFQCEVTDFGQTNCAVLEGEVAFSSLENREASVALQAGQRSTIGPEENRPSDPTEISPETRQELQQVQERARTALQLPPQVTSLELNGTEFQKSIRLAYSERTSLTLSGTALAPEDNAQLTDVRASVNGEQRSVDGLAEWSLTLEPEVPPAGEQTTVELTLRAVDSNQNQSDPRTVTITLVNQSETTQQDAEGLPSGYESGRVDVQLVSLAGRAPSNVEYPLHLYRPDASEGGLTIQGTASGDASVENVAYSLDGGQTWQRATGAENWSIDLPAGSRRELTLQVRAWTADGIIGSPVEFGPIIYRPVSYEQAIRETFEAFWTAFERKDARATVSYVHPDFQLDQPGPRDGESETLSRSQFRDFLQDEFRDFLNLRVFYSVSSIFGNPTGGQLDADIIEWKMRCEDEGSNRFFPCSISDDASLKFRRRSNGKYQVLSFQNFRPRPFIGFDGIVASDTDGYFGGPQSSVQSNDNNPDFSSLFGHFIFGLENTRTFWPGSPPRLYVNPSTLSADNNYDNPQSFCVSTCEGSVVEGGIYKTSYTSFDRVETIPKVGDNTYKNQVELKKGPIYAVNYQYLSQSGDFTTTLEQKTYLLQVREFSDFDTDPYPEEVRFRVISTGGGPTREFSGVNPFE